jgi:hypothetical protein
MRPDDRGDHSKGVKGPQMDLIFRPPPKKTVAVGDVRPPV